MRDHFPEIRARGAELVVIGNGAQHFAAAFREDMGLDGPLLVDPGLRAYRAAGLRRGRVGLLSPRLPLHALRALRAGYRQTSAQGDPWQLGGVFVIRPDASLAYRHASREAGDHAPIQAILAALDPDAPALALADLGAEVQLLGRSRERGEAAATRIREQTGNRVVVNSIHPGWADTPAVRSSIPGFWRVAHQILRSSADGADTVVWLAASERGRALTGSFFFDREPRRTHWLPWTRESEADPRRPWRLAERNSGAGPPRRSRPRTGSRSRGDASRVA